jgi:hypothetical protein
VVCDAQSGCYVGGRVTKVSNFFTYDGGSNDPNADNER